jgi:hypothetical protein
MLVFQVLAMILSKSTPYLTFVLFSPFFTFDNLSVAHLTTSHNMHYTLTIYS